MQFDSFWNLFFPTLYYSVRLARGLSDSDENMGYDNFVHILTLWIHRPIMR